MILDSRQYETALWAASAAPQPLQSLSPIYPGCRTQRCQPSNPCPSPQRTELDQPYRISISPRPDGVSAATDTHRMDNREFPQLDGFFFPSPVGRLVRQLWALERDNSGSTPERNEQEDDGSKPQRCKHDSSCHEPLTLNT